MPLCLWIFALRHFSGACGLTCSRSRSAQTRSYSQVAKAIGQPSASRAVARACATNPVAVAIPCHRVVREDGDISGYRWGMERKKTLLEMEQRGV